MSTRVFLNLLNELRKSVKMRGWSSILSLFHNKFNRFSSTRAQMLDSIYLMTLRLLIVHLKFSEPRNVEYNEFFFAVL